MPIERPRFKMPELHFTDNSKMPFGKYYGYKLIDVPADYLLWLHSEKPNDSRLREYIKSNLIRINERAHLENLDKLADDYYEHENAGDRD